MAPKVLILTGAPNNHSLDWDSDELLDNFLDPIARFCGLCNSSSPGATGKESGDESILDSAVWRSIPLEKTRLPTGFSQVHAFDGEYQGDQGFFSTLSATYETIDELPDREEESQAVLDQFYEHSLAVHDDIPSSQLPPESSSTNISSFYSTDGSLESSVAADNSSVRREDRTLGLGTAHLSDLEDIPNATYIRSITPQTMTSNLIVGVISIAEPRTVRTRWGTTKSLVELIVGDETKSGFSITFWLSQDSDMPTEQTLKTLRRQDIVLLRNVALSDFMNKVHGHSIRKGLTKIDLLYRRKLDIEDAGGFYSAKDLSSKKDPHHPQVLKTKRVREWVLNFVGEGRKDHVVMGKRVVRNWELPPADTQ